MLSVFFSDDADDASQNVDLDRAGMIKSFDLSDQLGVDTPAPKLTLIPRHKQLVRRYWFLEGVVEPIVSAEIPWCPYIPSWAKHHERG